MSIGVMLSNKFDGSSSKRYPILFLPPFDPFEVPCGIPLLTTVQDQLAKGLRQSWKLVADDGRPTREGVENSVVDHAHLFLTFYCDALGTRQYCR